MILFTALAQAQTNPVPLVNQPLVPASVTPGHKGFNLTVNGNGFSDGSVVDWNGATRVTQFISGHQLIATIDAKDVEKAGTASITVLNPAPGGGTSNVVFFPIREMGASVSFSAQAGFPAAQANAVGDFNNDGKLDVAVGIANSNGTGEIDIYLGNGDGTFGKPIKTTTVTEVLSLLAADFNGDGKLGLVYHDCCNTTVFLGDGKGGMTQQQVFRSPNGGMAAADLNGDGKLDLVVSGFVPGGEVVNTYLGNGDGTFQLNQQIGIDTRDSLGGSAIGDFNGDGNLDLAVAGEYYVFVLLGNGDGTFQKPVDYSGGYGTQILTADVNGDGILDLVTNGVSVFLGKGDGTFVEDGSVGVSSPSGVSVADIEGGANLDLAVFSSYPTDSLNILLGNGNGSFNNPLQFGGDERATNLSIGDFNQDGMLDVVAGNLFLQVPVALTPSSINFGNQQVGTKSTPQTATLTNVGSSTLTINAIGINGNDPNDFSQSNNCGSSLPSGKSCQIQVVFDPTMAGTRDANLYVQYKGVGSPQTVALSGTGVDLTVTLTPSSMTFATQLINTTSPAQTATLTNTSSSNVSISQITTTGPFGQTNNCPSSLPPNNSCQIKVTFTPTTGGPASGSLEVYDNAEGSPQTVTLSGTGTVVKLSTSGINFGDQKVGKKSSPAPVKLTNEGSTSLSITAITITGTNSGDFSETNNCGDGVPAGGSCTIKVTFDPTGKGQRSATLEIEDNGGGSPQTVSLEGTGT